MFGSRQDKRHEKTGVLAARQAVAKAQHPRVAEPTARSVLAGSGPLEVATVGAEASVFDALTIMAERDTAAVAVVSPAGIVGVYSERDHARNRLAPDRTARDTPVREAVTGVVARVAPADSVRRCLDLMNEQALTHAAVFGPGRVSRARLL
jgi:CBS domain-containing protein